MVSKFLAFSADFWLLERLGSISQKLAEKAKNVLVIKNLYQNLKKSPSKL